MVRDMNIIKVIFKPKRLAPVKCKDVEYLVNEPEMGLALSIAKEVFKCENELYKYYDSGIAMKPRVI